MKAIKEWDETYLDELIKIGEMESLTLDYKASDALKKQDKEKNDLAKDVSAFANSAGGILLYGMLENKHVPTTIDSGFDRNGITKQVARIERQLNPGFAATLAPDFVSLNPSYSCSRFPSSPRRHGKSEETSMAWLRRTISASSKRPAVRRTWLSARS